MFSDIYHVGYLTDDMAKAIEFYERVLDGKVKAQVLAGDGVTKMAFLRIGSTEVELIEPADKSRMNGRTGLVLDHIGYVVSDINAAKRALEAKGVRFEGEPRLNAEGATLVYADAETTAGTRLHLTQRPAVT